MAASTSAAGTPSATTTARSRWTDGWRAGVAPPRVDEAAGRDARDRDLGDEDALGPELERLDGLRMQLPDPADEIAA